MRTDVGKLTGDLCNTSADTTEYVKYDMVHFRALITSYLKIRLMLYIC